MAGGVGGDAWRCARRASVHVLAILLLASAVSPAQTIQWVSAYYAGWQSSYLPPGSIDFTAITQLVHFSIYPTGGANFDGTGNGVTPGV